MRDFKCNASEFGPEMLHSQTAVICKTCVKRPLSKIPKIGFQDQLLLNAGQKHCRMLPFRPSLGYHLSLRSLYVLFLSGRLTQVLLYMFGSNIHLMS